MKDRVHPRTWLPMTANLSGSSVAPNVSFHHMVHIPGNDQAGVVPMGLATLPSLVPRMVSILNYRLTGQL